MSENKKYSFRYLAQVTVEAETPLAVSNGEEDLICDLLVATDANGIPMIPGTSLCGVLRNSLAEARNEKQVIHNKDLPVGSIDKLFGWQKAGTEHGEGSRLIISSAHIIDEDGKVIEGLLSKQKSGYLQALEKLPVRQHCKINHRGAADTEAHGKFDNQVLLKGVRFKFEIELVGDKEDDAIWNELLDLFKSPVFRIGGGTRKGYGKLKIIELKKKVLDLSISHDLDEYLEKTSSLNSHLKVETDSDIAENTVGGNWTKYTLTITPDDFFLFGSGYPDEDVDMTPVYENVVEWDKNNKPKISERMILIPASSIKGAISHRTAYHFNRISEKFADKLGDGEKIEDFVGENNPAVKALFGCANDSSDQKNKKDSSSGNGIRGNVIMSDIFLPNEKKTKILNHVAIDRFTGGAMDGMLFDEKVIAQQCSLNLEIHVNKKAFEVEKPRYGKKEHIQEAFECALNDICKGLLPLGGGVMRGHGCFTGKWEKI